MRRSVSLLVVIVGIISAFSGISRSQVVWHNLGHPVSAPICVFFFNSQVGVVAGHGEVEYTTNGVDWQPASIPIVLPAAFGGISVIRSFDNKTLYAIALLDTSLYASSPSNSVLLQSVDSGQTWDEISGGIGGGARDLYLNNSGVPTLLPDSIGATIGRIDALHLIAVPDDLEDEGDTTAVYSKDGGISWISVARKERWGLGCYVDPVTKICYGISELSDTMYSSIDSGKSWHVLQVLPKSVGDEIVGNSGHIYIQSTNGIYRSDDGFKSWTNIGGPAALWDDRRYCVCGCDGLCVVVFDGRGNVWMSEVDNGGPPFVTITNHASQCDTTGFITVTIDGVTPSRQLSITIAQDTTAPFHLPINTINCNAAGATFQIPYSLRFSTSASARLIITDPSACEASIEVRNLNVQASWLSCTLQAPKVQADCNTPQFEIEITNPNCTYFHVITVTSTSTALGAFDILSADSIVEPYATDSIHFRFRPNPTTGSGTINVRVQGYLLPFYIPFDTTVAVSVSSQHTASQLLAPRAP